MGRRTRQKNTLFIFTLLSLCVVTLRADWQNGDMNDKLARGEIMVEIKKVTGTSMRIGRAAGVIEATPEQVWSIIGDYNHYAGFMPRLKECFMIRPDALPLIDGIKSLHAAEPILRANTLDSLNTDTVLLYSCLDLPIPLGDKRYIIQIVHNRSTFSTHWVMVRGDLKVNDGSWELFPYEGKTLAVYTSCSDPGIPIPTALISMATKFTLPDIITAVRDRAKSVSR